jgi:hypothetical protein
VLVFAAVPPAAAALLAVYFARLPDRGAIDASNPLQPVMIVWALAVLGLLYVCAVALSQVRSQMVRTLCVQGAQLSFGVYLIHPLVLDVILLGLRKLGLLTPNIWVALLAFVLTVAITFGVSAALRRSKLSPALIGRARASATRTRKTSVSENPLAPDIGRPAPRLRVNTGSTPANVVADLYGLTRIGQLAGGLDGDAVHCVPASAQLAGHRGHRASINDQPARHELRAAAGGRPAGAGQAAGVVAEHRPRITAAHAPVTREPNP